MSFGALATPPGAPSPSFGAPPPPMSFGAAAPQSRGFFGTSSQSCAAPRPESFRGFGSSSERTRGRGQKKGFSSQSAEITFDGGSDSESGDNSNVQVRFRKLRKLIHLVD